MNKNSSELVSKLSPPLDKILTEAIIKEFIAMERRFFLGDWEPATLDGGQFSEVAARIIYNIDSGNLNRRKGLDDCLSYVEDEKNHNQHKFPQKRTALHLCKVLRTIYKFRSQRGAVHIDPDYTANEMDASLVMANVRWAMAELVRVFLSGSPSDAASTVREIIRFEIPAVLLIDGRHFVLRTDCTIEEEILLVLHNAGDNGLTRKELGVSIPKPAPSITNAIVRLCSQSKREVIKRKDQKYVLTPNGNKRVREELTNKLSLS